MFTAKLSKVKDSHYNQNYTSVYSINMNNLQELVKQNID